MSDDELIERIDRALADAYSTKAEVSGLLTPHMWVIRAILPLIHEARIEGGKMVQEACAKDAETWFPAGSAERYPSSGVVASIRALNVEDIIKSASA